MNHRSCIIVAAIGALAMARSTAVAQSLAPDSMRPTEEFPRGHLQATGGGPLQSSLVLGIRLADSIAVEDTVKRQRPRAIELSNGYAVRLKIHQIASYLELPVFAAELLVGQRLYQDEQNGVRSSGSLRGAHSALAGTLGVLFGVNTITGIWNLAEGWKDPTGRTRRVIHSLAMLAADAGFVATAATAPGGREGVGSSGSTSRANTHRTLAISSAAVATAATLMMWLWKS